MECMIILIQLNFNYLQLDRSCTHHYSYKVLQLLCFDSFPYKYDKELLVYHIFPMVATGNFPLIKFKKRNH